MAASLPLEAIAVVAIEQAVPAPFCTARTADSAGKPAVRAGETW